jgi:hypothetical protein
LIYSNQKQTRLENMFYVLGRLDCRAFATHEPTHCLRGEQDAIDACRIDPRTLSFSRPQAGRVPGNEGLGSRGSKNTRRADRPFNALFTGHHLFPIRLCS